MKKSYYEFGLANQNYVAKPNLVWVADITSFELYENKKVYVFLCMDIFSNKILVSIFKTKTITSNDIVKKLQELVDKRLPIRPRRELILHTDRGSQFTSTAYNEFILSQEGFICPSMVRANTPKDNAVAERFIHTFKKHKINNKTFQQEPFHQIEINSRFRGYRRIFNLYVKDLGLKPNTKSKIMSPERHDTDAQIASMLMTQPNYSKAFSEVYGTDFRREHIDQYKSESMGVTSIFDEITSKRAELVDKTPFDDYESNLAIQVIDDHLKSIYGLILKNPELTRVCRGSNSTCTEYAGIDG